MIQDLVHLSYQGSLLKHFLFLPFPIVFYHGNLGYNYLVRALSWRMKHSKVFLGPWYFHVLFFYYVMRIPFSGRSQVQGHRLFSRGLVHFVRIWVVGLGDGLKRRMVVVCRHLDQGPFLFYKILIFSHSQFYSLESQSLYSSCFYDTHRVLGLFFLIF